MQRLAGLWAGTYDYLEPDVKCHHAVGFTLEVFDGSSWRLHGEVVENPITGAEGRGTIRGWSWGRYVWFRKVMPNVQVAHDPKPIGLDEYLQAEFGEHLSRDPEPHSLSYWGVVAPDRQAIKGTWRLAHRRLSLASGRVVTFPAALGTWKMRRQ
jgi:hypothetical protein